MRKNPESTVIKLEVNEEQEKFNIQYDGSMMNIIANFLTAIVIVLKKNGFNRRDPKEIQSFCDSFANTLRKELS